MLQAEAFQQLVGRRRRAEAHDPRRHTRSGRAYDPRLKRDVAIKVLPPHLASDGPARARFEREVTAELRVGAGRRSRSQLRAPTDPAPP